MRGMRCHLGVAVFLTLTDQLVWTNAFSPMHVKTSSLDSVQSVCSAPFMLLRGHLNRPGRAMNNFVNSREDRRRQCLQPVLSMQADESPQAKSLSSTDGASRKARIAKGSYQEAALSGMLSDGQLVPDNWMPGEHFDYADSHSFKPDEMVVVLCKGGSVRFGRVQGPATGVEDAGANESRYIVNIGGASFRSKNMLTLSAGELGKVLPLSSQEIQRLGIPRPPGTEGDGRQAGLLASLKTFVDVDKQIASDSLPFQPMFSRRASAAPPSAAPVLRDDGGEKTVQRQVSSGGAGRPEGWGELLGWWQEGRTLVFQVEVNRPLAMELDEVEGEGVLVTRVEEGGNAQRAGVRVGDVIEVASRGGQGWSGEYGVVLAAVASSAETVKVRFRREEVGAAGRGKAQIWRERSAPERRGSEERKVMEEAVTAVEVTVEKPLGMRLREVPGVGIVVEKVNEGGNAAAAGVRVGDRVVASSARPSHESGIEFDRGTTYAAANYGEGQAGGLERFLREVQEGTGREVVLGLERMGARGLEALERQRAAERLGSVDAQLSAKVKGKLLGQLALYDANEDDVIPDLAANTNRVLKINVDLTSYQAKQQLIRRNYEEAERLYRECIRLDSYDGRGWLGLARVMRKRKMGLQAREVLVEGVLRNPDNAFLLQALGTLDQAQGNFARAMARFEEAIAVDPKHAASWVAKGQLEERMRRTGRARQSYEEATRVAPWNHYAWQCLAVLEAKEGNGERARVLFRRCAEARPENAAVWQAWGVLEQKEGNVEEARRLLGLGLEANPKNTFVLQALGCLEWEAGNTTGGKALLEKAIALRPSDGGAYQAYAARLWRQGAITRARDLFVRGTTKAKRHTALWQAWALMEAKLGNVEKARSLFQQGVWDAGSGKTVHTLWQAWGVLEGEQGNVQRARQYLSRAVESTGRPGASLVAWSQLEERAGRVGKARELLERGVTEEPYNWQLWEALEAFERRVSGRGSEAERGIHKRRALAEMYHAKQREEAQDESDRGGRGEGEGGSTAAVEGSGVLAQMGPWLPAADGPPGAGGAGAGGSSLVPKQT